MPVAARLWWYLWATGMFVAPKMVFLCITNRLLTMIKIAVLGTASNYHVTYPANDSGHQYKTFMNGGQTATGDVGNQYGIYFAQSQAGNTHPTYGSPALL